MDFDFINELVAQLNNNNIFKYTFKGVQVFALAMLLFRVIDAFIKDFEDTPKFGNILSLLGYGLIIISSDWIITSIDSVFASVQTNINSTESDVFLKLLEQAQKHKEDMLLGADDIFAKIDIWLSNFFIAFMILVGLVLGMIIKLADMAVVSGYLIQRVFILQLLKFLFPLAIAFSTSFQFQRFFYSWIMRYIGVFILGIAYIGILSFIRILQPIILNQFDTGDPMNSGFYGIGLLTAMVITFSIKLKLFSTATSYVNSMFN